MQIINVGNEREMLDFFNRTIAMVDTDWLRSGPDFQKLVVGTKFDIYVFI